MRPRPSPLDIPELAERCISLLHDSYDDLVACATVKRSWTYFAQSYLFKDVGLSIEDGSCARLLDVFTDSPHLIRFVLRMNVWVEFMSPEEFAALAALPFLNIRVLHICSRREPSSQAATAIQQFLALPRLEYVKLKYTLRDLDQFERTLERASPSIKHLLLCLESTQGSPALVFPSPKTRTTTTQTRMQISSLRMVGDSTFLRWLATGRSAIDLSRLRTLDLRGCDSTILCTPAFASAAAGLEVLHVDCFIVPHEPC
ncbi:hypothetical protein B0H17DRAFT_1053111 [Mycena rosella]|uniref:Uncharacterized protein n=1 Tax=Mycena rosella TaxID=1033263 RepID=A0AAD7DQB0_MYCRO|nr:hypothetical protein B0H17DRAFT_1053111 [Mycena rosella]